MNAPAPGRRLMMIELDSLSLPFVREHLDALPTLRGLIETVGAVETQSTADIASASVWPTFSTGTLPGVHGHYFPFQWHPGRMRFHRTYSSAWKGALDYEPFWYDLARGGIDCLVLDAAQTVNHVVSPCLEINDWSAQSTGHAMASNREVLRELRRRFGKRPIGMEIAAMKSRAQAERLQRVLIRSLRQKVEAAIWLGRTQRWRFYLMSIQDMHRAGHNLWPIESDFASEVPKNALLEVCRALDHGLSNMLTAFDDGNTDFIVFTLNGMEPNRAQNHLLPQILHRLNRLRVTGRSETGVSERRLGLIPWLRDRLPSRLQLEANRLLGEKVQDWVVNREYTAHLDWAETPSFNLSTGGEGLVRLNIAGRERRGILEPDSSALNDYISWLSERLLAIRVPATGEPLVRRVSRISDHFPGERAQLLPDLALEWGPSQPATEVVSEDIGIVRNRLRTGRGGNHNGQSFALFTGRFAGRPPQDAIRHISDYAEYVRALMLA
ncbi:MAG: alkaline phosphatase family protein [Lysobacterales bacterium]|jgi:predicted AlkP superfamily phosphohydrolase/phosphomutase